MISRINRFRGRRGPRIVMKHGKVVRTAGMQARFLINPSGGDRKVAVVVSKKVTKSAPKRNRIRRRIYDIISKQLESLPEHINFVVSVFEEDAATEDHKTLEEKVVNLLEKIEP